MIKKKTQIDEIKKYLETHKQGITSLEAIERFGATRLSGIIYVLRYKRGMPIITEHKIVTNRFGGISNIAVYKLKDEFENGKLETNLKRKLEAQING